MNFPVPNNEQTRLNALRGDDFFDSISEKDFGYLVALASKICEAPNARASLMDAGPFAE